jgi:glycerophosphoryl diester phosphodiesterase
VWTVNSADDMRAMVGLGVDAVITDRLVDALEVARGGGSP